MSAALPRRRADAPEPDQLAGGHTTRTEANARLTSLAGMVLFVLLAVQGLTILSIHALLGAHVVVGFVLLGPLTIKLGSTGWRFLRYYTGDPEYAAAGPPRPLLRVLAPLLVVLTVAVFASGVGLLAVSPGRGSTLVFIHKASFVLWFGVTTIHVLAYLAPAVKRTAADLAGRGPGSVLASRRSRQVLLGVSLAIGVAVGVAGLGWAHPWVSRGSVDGR